MPKQQPTPPFDPQQPANPAAGATSYPQAPQAPYAQPAPMKPKKPFYKPVWFWLLALVALVILGSALGGGNKGQQATQTTAGSATTQVAPAKSTQAPAQTQAAEKERLTLNDGWKLDKSNPYMSQVVGSVANNSDAPINTYVSITFDALDSSGANVGTCLANTNTIDAKGTWKFKALCTGEGIAKVRFKAMGGI